jgi:hypothetical protein
MLARSTPSQVVATTAGVALAGALPAMRQIVQEVLDAREQNIAFQRGIKAHEADQVASLASAKSQGQQSGGSRGGGRGGSGNRMAPRNKADLRLRPPKSGNVPSRVPRNIAGMLVWDIVKIRNVNSTNTSIVTEQNFSFYLQLHPQYANWAALYDQYTIVQVSLSFYSHMPPGSGASPIEMHTAIDFDNSANIATLANIDDYASAQVDNLMFNKVVTRSCQPCVKLSAASTNNIVPSREWIDTGVSTTANFYGIRTMAAPADASATNYTTELTIWFAFRNSI